MKNKPNPTLAGFLCLINPMLGMLYAARIAWAALYLVALLGAGVLALVFQHRMPVVGVVLLLAVYVVSVIHAYRLAWAYPDEKPRPHYSRWYGLIGTYLGLMVVIFGLRTFLFEPFKLPSGSMLPTIEAGSYLVVQKWGYGHYGSFGFTPFQRPISSDLRRGDIIVFDHPSDDGASVQFAKRLIGLPGDKVTYRDKKLSINGNEVPHNREGDYLAVRAGRETQRLIRFAESLDGANYSVALDEEANWNITEVPTFERQKECTYDDHGETCEIPAGQYFVMGDNRDNSNDSRYWGFVPADHIVGKVIQVF